MSNEFKQEIKQALLKKRENLSESSLKTYSTLLYSILKKANLKMDLQTFSKEKNKIIEEINNIKSEQSKKTILSALYVLTGIDDYQKNMMNSLQSVNDYYKTQKMTNRQKENMLSREDIENKMEDLFVKVKQEPTITNYQNLLLLGLTSGIYIPPRRNEYSSVLVKNFDKEKDNYFEKNTFYFNDYKTASKYGKQSVKLPNELKPYMGKYLKLIGDIPYMFFSPSSKNMLTTASMSKRLSAIFGKQKGIGVSMLRVAFLTNKYKDIPAIQEMEETAKQMGHSSETALGNYVKKG